MLGSGASAWPYSSSLPTTAGDYEKHTADDRDPAEQGGNRVLLVDGALDGADVDGATGLNVQAFDNNESAQRCKQDSSNNQKLHTRSPTAGAACLQLAPEKSRRESQETASDASASQPESVRTQDCRRTL